MKKCPVIVLGLMISAGFATTGILEANLPQGSPALDYTTCEIYLSGQKVADVQASGAFEFNPSLTTIVKHKKFFRIEGSKLLVQTNAPQEIVLATSDMNGRQAFRTSINSPAGFNSFKLKKNYAAAPGLYFLRVTSKKNTAVFKSMFPITGITSNAAKQNPPAYKKMSAISTSEKLTFVCSGYIPAVSDVDLSLSDLGTISVTLPKPNILLLISDDLNDYLGFMKDKPSPGDGHPHALTPNIDALAASGVKFMNAHTQAPLCGPARATMLYSLYPSTTGIYLHPGSAEFNAAASINTNMIDYFNDNGYKTIGQGKINHSQISLDFDVGETRSNWGPRPNPPISYDESNLVYEDGTTTSATTGGTMTDWGYWDEYDPNGGSRDETDMTDYQVANFAIDQLGQTHNSPFFMSIGFVKPHNPWINPWEYNDLHPQNELTVPGIKADDWDDIPEQITDINTMEQMPPFDWMTEDGHYDERTRGILQSYLGSVSFSDAQVGRVMAALNASEYKDNTIIIFISDHGYHMGEKRVWQKQSLWRESTRIPFIVNIPNMPNTREDMTPIGMIDIYPTLLELCGMPANNNNEGLSLAGLVYDPATEFPRNTIRTTWGRGNHSLMSKTHQYVKVSRGGNDYEELYNFIEDPFEHTNLVGNAYESIKSAFRVDLPNRSQESEWTVEIEPAGKFDP